MRSVVVVLPASIWAAIPMLRVRCIGYCRFGELGEATGAGFVFSNTASIYNPDFSWLRTKAPRERSAVGARLDYILLPAEMCKCLVGLGHLMHLIAFTDGVSQALVGFHDFGGQCFSHGDALPRISEIHEPAQCQGELPIRRDFQRHLVGCATNAPGLYFEAWLGVIHGALENVQRIGGRILFSNLIEGAINNALRHGLFPTDHDRIHQTRNQRAVELRIFQDRPSSSLTSSGHDFCLKKLKVTESPRQRVLERLLRLPRQRAWRRV